MFTRFKVFPTLYVYMSCTTGFHTFFGFGPIGGTTIYVWFGHIRGVRPLTLVVMGVYIGVGGVVTLYHRGVRLFCQGICSLSDC